MFCHVIAAISGVSLNSSFLAFNVTLMNDDIGYINSPLQPRTNSTMIV